MLQRCKYELIQKAVVAVLVAGTFSFAMLFGTTARAYESLGLGTDALLGGDLTDPEDDGDPEFDDGYDAIFDANSEPGFGDGEQPEGAGGGEAAFNVFDNILGPGNDKWCCGKPGGFPEEGLWITAELDEPYLLTHFTVSSANDEESRDPISWAVQGSNDGENFTDIYTYEDDFGPWVDRLEVIQFSAPEDFPVQETGYTIFRHVTYESVHNINNNAAYFQIGEIEYFGEPGGVADALQAGDADMDCDFDQLDLVQVQIAGKYLTGQAATWGEGDWDGAPGGSVADKTPPPGNGLFDQLDVIAALNAGGYLTGSYCAAAEAAIAPEGTPDDAQTSIVYDFVTGEISVDAPASTSLTSINIDSASGMFPNHENAQNLDGSFDTHSETNIFKATFGSSFGDISFGTIATPGLAEALVADDLTVIGSLEGGGGLGDVDLIYVPEPSTVMLLGLGLALMLIRRRR